MDAVAAAFRLVVSVIICCNAGVRGGVQGAEAKYRRFCYLDTMAQLRSGAGRFTLGDLHDVTLCTHLVFVHALVDTVNLDLAPALQGDFEYYKEVTDLKTSNPDLQVLLFVGGPDPSLQQTGWSAAFSRVVNSTETIEVFVNNVVSYLRYFGFDGLELDWRYPALPSSPEVDVHGLSVLVQKMREELDKAVGGEDDDHRLLLTVRVSGDRYVLQDSVQLDQVIGSVDYVVVTAYDFYLSDSTIGHQSGLFGRNGESNAQAVLNADYIVQYLTQYKEVPGEQIILGIPSFGRTVLFKEDSPQAFGAPHNGSGPPGPYTGQSGLLAFYEICSLVNNGWTEVEGGDQLTPFAFSEQEIVTYDNPDSVAVKANYIKDQGLAGAALWDLSFDDFSGVFCEQGPFPLTTALRSALTSPRSWCPAGERGFLDVSGCESCAVGTYQPAENSMACLPCSPGLTTLSAASTHPYHCILPCASGSEYNYVTATCDPCPLGFYRLEGRDPACLKCPRGQTTVTTASSDCVRRPDGVPEMTPRQIDVTATVTFAVKSCENSPVIVGALRLLMADYFQRLAQAWSGLCHSAACDNVNTTVIQGCDRADVRRRRSQQRLLASIIVGNTSEEVNNTESIRQTHSVIAAALSDQREYQPLETYGIWFVKLETLEKQIVCEIGSAARNGRCEQCLAGTFHNTSVGTCMACPVGHYQDLQGQTSCQACEGVMTTITSGAAAGHQCVSPCQARPSYCFNQGECRWSEADRGAVYCQCPQAFQGERCEVGTETHSSSSAGTIVGAVVGGILAFLIIVLIIVACCVCFRMRKAVELRPAQPAERHSVRSAVTPNHYMSWGSFSKGSLGHRGVKFVDYIDYYMWLNSLSGHNHHDGQQQTGKSHSYSAAKSRSDHQSSAKTSLSQSTPPPTAAPPASALTGHSHTPSDSPHHPSKETETGVRSVADQD